MNDLTAIGARPIRQPDARSFVEAVRITMFIFALATPFFVYMGLSASNVQEEYRLSKLVEHRRQLVKEHERLLLTRDALLSPDAVNAAAREKLGMVEEDAMEWTVGVPPEKERANEPTSQRASDKKNKAEEKSKPDQGAASVGIAPTSAAEPAAKDKKDKPKAKPHKTKAHARGKRR